MSHSCINILYTYTPLEYNTSSYCLNISCLCINILGEAKSKVDPYDEDTENFADAGTKASCTHHGTQFLSGEIWSNEDKCTQCVCRNGVVVCNRMKCELPAACTLARVVPGSCCPVCDGKSFSFVN